MSKTTHALRAGLPVALATACSLASQQTFAQSAATQPSVPLPPVEVTTPASKPKPRKVAPQPVANATPQAVAPRPERASGVQNPAATSPGLGATAGGQPVTTIDRASVENTRAFSVGDLLSEVPGVSIKQGNGPRDMGVSIRGSNARNGFAVRNIQVFEDGFPVTQPDGLSRTDLTDPHAYGGVDVWRGPSSALFGNYATGGAINFRTRNGAEVNGFEYGIDVGSFGYLNNYLTLGEKKGNFEYALFASDVRSNGHLDYNAFNTQTVNLLASFTPSSSDKFTFKFIHNSLDTQLSSRLTLNQFFQNPYQKGCDANYSAALAATGCASGNFNNNGFNNANGTQRLTAAQAGFNRNDYRTLAGLRWEHKVDANTEWQVQAVVDDRNINQPTGTTSAIGDYLSTNLMASLKQRYSFFGLPAVHLAGVWYNTLPSDAYTYAVMPGGNATLGRLTQNVNGGTQNAGARVREEITPMKGVTFVLGADVEQTHLWGLSTNYTYGGTTPTVSTSTVSADRTFMSHAQEAGLVVRPSSEWQLRGRVATGYGTPQIGNLFVNSSGNPGDNTSLQPQTNIGYDLGADWTPTRAFKLSVTGFYEFFQNEIVSQGTAAQTFQFNAPRSEHRGIELAADWAPLPGWRATAAYLYMDQFYTEYVEQLSTYQYNRDGNKIPGNSPNELNARLGYDQPTGALKGLGAYVEYQWKDAFYLDNGNYLKAPGYELYNLNIHYTPELRSGPVKAVSFYFEVRNLLDKTYIASANNITNSQSGGIERDGAWLAQNASGSIYTGLPRTFYGGMKVKF